MKHNALKIRHSLRFSVISRLFALIIMSLTALGGYQFNQIGEQAIQDSQSDKVIASSYFSTVLVQAIWEFDEPLIDELVAAQSNINSLIALSVPSLSPDNAPLFLRNEDNVFTRTSDSIIPQGKIVLKTLNIQYGEQNIGSIILYFDDDFYQKTKQNDITQLLVQLLGVALILLAVFYYFINRYVVTPISNLYQSVESLSHNNNLKIDIQENLPNNEIKLLAQKYSDAYYQLSTYKDHLEELVATRTTGLENANEKMKVEINSRIASEEAMELAKIEAQTANRAKTRFLSHITHELRTPLNGILGYAQILADHELPEAEKEFTSHILRCSSHLLELINNILDSNKIESSQLEVNLTPTSIASLLEQIKTIVYPRCASKGLALEFELSKEIPESVLVDSAKLKQVLINLLANAIKFTDKGFVRLSVVKTNDGEYVFSVADSGQGIPEKDQASVFEPYIQSLDTGTTDASTGLGLSISKSFIQSLGSELKLESQFGKGSRFFFAIKLEDAAIETALDVSKKIIGLQGCENKLILIVDDNKDNLFILKKILKGVGFRVVEALSAKLAFEAIETETPNLIFMDVQMPEMDGTEASEIIKRSHHDLTIIAFTANTYDENGASLESESFDDYIYKPVNRQVIYQMLMKYLSVSAVHD